MTLRVLLLALTVSGLLPACRRAEVGVPAVSPPAPYLEVVTGGAGPTEALPLVIAVHGFGDRPESFSGLASGFSGRARWIFPRGFEAQGGGHAWFPIRFRDGRAEALAAGLQAASERLARLVEELRRARPSDRPVIVTGFSQGGMMSFALAVQSSPVVDAAFPVSGWLPLSMIPADRTVAVPIFALHGVDDRIVPFEATQAMMETLVTRADRAEFQAFEGVGHHISPEMRALLFEQIAAAISAPIPP